MSGHAAAVASRPGESADQVPELGVPCRDARGITAQFGRPHGLTGHAIGLLMAVKNRAMSHAALDALLVQPGDRVLEIGFGPGVALAALASHGEAACIAGVDPSAVMLAQARRRCLAARDPARFDLRPGTAAELPWRDGTFQRVLAVNSFHLWDDPAADLFEVRRVMAPGARLVLGLRVALARPRRLTAPGLRDDQIARVPALLGAAGFAHTRIERRPAGSREMALVVADA